MTDPVYLIDEVLSPEHRSKVEGFKCSSEKEVEVFLKKDAWELQHYNMAVTRLFFNKDKELVGYFTLYNDAVPKMNKDKMKKENWNLPNTEKYFPAIRLHYFGVDERYVGQGIGYAMLMAAIDICSSISEYTGCTFISVQALNSAVGFYEHYDFKSVGREKNYRNMVFKLQEAEE